MAFKITSYAVCLLSEVSTQILLPQKKMLIAVRGPVGFANHVSKSSEEMNHLNSLLDERQYGSYKSEISE